MYRIFPFLLMLCFQANTFGNTAIDSLKAPQLGNRIASNTTFRNSTALGSGTAAYLTSYKYIGISMNYYHVGLTPISVYISDFNRLNDVANKHNYLTYAPGITLGYQSDYGMGIEFSRNAARSATEYSQYAIDSSVVDIKERIRLVNSQIKLSFTTSVPKLKGLRLGASLDFGLIRNNIKRSGGDYSGKWEAFYTHTGLSKGFKTSELIAGIGIRAGYLLNHFQFMASTQFLFMDNEVSGYAGKDLLMNTQHYQISISYAFE